MTGAETAELECLHCGQTKDQVKASQSSCATETGYEYVEIDNEWPRHRWVDWSDKDLAANGIRPRKYEAYRRQPITQFEYVSCADTTRGHNIASEAFPEAGIKAGQCYGCGHIEGKDS